MNTLRLIVWPQEIVEVAKVLQKKSASVFWLAKLIYVHEKKVRGQSMYTPKTFKIKKDQKSKNVVLIL